MGSTQTCFGTCTIWYKTAQEEATSWNCIRKLVFSTLETFKMGSFPQYIFASMCTNCLAANIYLSSYVHWRPNICHQWGNIFGKSSDFNCHFFPTSNMWSLLYHTLHKNWLCNNIVAPFLFYDISIYRQQFGDIWIYRQQFSDILIYRQVYLITTL